MASLVARGDLSAKLMIKSLLCFLNIHFFLINIDHDICKLSSSSDAFLPKTAGEMKTSHDGHGFILQVTEHITNILMPSNWTCQ